MAKKNQETSSNSLLAPGDGGSERRRVSARKSQLNSNDSTGEQFDGAILAGYDKPKTPFELVDPSGSIRITQLSPVGEIEDSQRMTATGKSFNHKRPQSNRNQDSESKAV